jgi:hypothetical protein
METRRTDLVFRNKPGDQLRRLKYFSNPVDSWNVSCKIWDCHCGDYEQCRLLGFINPVRTTQETHYVAATEPSQLMLCKIWGFHGCDYEECRLLGYKTPVHTSQEAHYLSSTDSSRLMQRKVWLFHGGDSEECRLFGCDAAWLLLEPTFRRNI